MVQLKKADYVRAITWLHFFKLSGSNWCNFMWKTTLADKNMMVFLWHMGPNFDLHRASDFPGTALVWNTCPLRYAMSHGYGRLVVYEAGAIRSHIKSTWLSECSGNNSSTSIRFVMAAWSASSIGYPFCVSVHTAPCAPSTSSTAGPIKPVVTITFC